MIPPFTNGCILAVLATICRALRERNEPNLRQVEQPGAETVRGGVELARAGHNREACDLYIRHSRSGQVPARGAGCQEELLSVNPEDWEGDLADSKQFFDKFGGRLPRELREEHEKLSRRLSTKDASMARSG